jgi:acyl dehydratase
VADPKPLAFKEGDTFESPSKTITDAHALFFAAVTGDNHPSHYDVEYAAAHVFGRPLMHGLMLASLTAAGASPLSRLMENFIFIEQGSRFRKPVFVGDTITPRLTVERIWMEKQRQFVRLATALYNQRKDLVLEGFQVYLIKESPT